MSPLHSAWPISMDRRLLPWLAVLSCLHLLPFVMLPALIGGDEPHYALMAHGRRIALLGDGLHHRLEHPPTLGRDHRLARAAMPDAERAPIFVSHLVQF